MGYLQLVKPGLIVVGMSCGLSNPLSSIYINEIAGKSNKGVVSSMFNFNLTLGILLTNVIGSLTRYNFYTDRNICFHYHSSWYVSSITGLLINVLITITLLILITSPYEAAKKQNFSSIPIILSRLR